MTPGTPAESGGGTGEGRIAPRPTNTPEEAMSAPLPAPRSAGEGATEDVTGGVTEGATVWDTPVTPTAQPTGTGPAAGPAAAPGGPAPMPAHAAAPGPGGVGYPPAPSAPPLTPDAAAFRGAAVFRDGAPAGQTAPGPVPASGPMPAAGPAPASGPMPSAGPGPGVGPLPAAAPMPQPVQEPAPAPASDAQTPAPAGTVAPLQRTAPVHTPTPMRRSSPTPVSVPLMPPEMDALRSRPRHGESVAQRAGRAVRRAIASSPAAETAAVTETAYAIQQPVTTGRQISVTSIRGGAGKSTVAALLALTYAHYRADPVLAIEADPALGTLPHRLGAREVRWSGTDLAQIVDPSMLITDLTGYLIPFPGGGWLLPGSQGAIGTRLDIDTYRVVMTSLRRYFATTVVDCETLPAEVARTALVTTQARVLVSPATPEGVAATRSVLDWVGGLHPGMLPTTVVVLSHVSPDSGLDVRKATEHLGIGGATVLPLPYDRHLAAGGAIRTELLGERTLQAAARIAAEAMNRAVSRGPGRQRTGPGAPTAPGSTGRPAPDTHPSTAAPAAPHTDPSAPGPGHPTSYGAPSGYGAPGAYGAPVAPGHPTPYGGHPTAPADPHGGPPR
ncbi:hypothetical protein Scani_70040 [Streptomyces caniferus]|uniref:CobQ/CobB/MinD/ParA nucleotide binding domain-containing protein n=2 Tax=Streptomyces caniferus TaxID=285557 RepID=A0A640SKR7_9ACTN|nr:hypothetical protein Scani_70040 [Streptomyces caniferus]